MVVMMVMLAMVVPMVTILPFAVVFFGSFLVTLARRTCSP